MTCTSTPGISGENGSPVKGNSIDAAHLDAQRFLPGEPEPLLRRPVTQEAAPFGEGVRAGDVAKPEVRPQDRFVELGEPPIARADRVPGGNGVGVVAGDVGREGKDVAGGIRVLAALKREARLLARPGDVSCAPGVPGGGDELGRGHARLPSCDRPAHAGRDERACGRCRP